MPEIVADNISIIHSNELESFSRLEAEYYRPPYLTSMNQLKKRPTLQLNSIAFVTDGIHASIDYDDGSQIRCLSAQYVKDDFFDLSANTFISENQHKMNLRTSLKTGDVILSSVGTIGNCAVVTDNILPANADRHVAIIRILNNKISPFYLSVFLNSKYGKFQTTREATGNVQPNLFIDKIKKLTIPNIASQNEIDELVRNAYDLLYSANLLYSQAETLLLEELDIKDLFISHEPCYEVNAFDAIYSSRIDAEYYQPKYEKIIKRVSRKYVLFTLNEIFDFKRGEFIDTSYYSKDKTSTPYLRIKELSNNSPINIDDVIYITNEYKRFNNKLQKGDLVIAIIGDTIGKTNLVTEEYEGGYCSNNTGRLRLKEHFKNKFDIYFLEKLFQSIFIQSQIEKRKAQTAQPKIADNEIKHICIPLIAQKNQNDIGNLIQQSHSTRMQAKNFLKQAKKKVEEMIEKGQG